jgi:ribosomal protein S18 acetylase RimI-like enzyme
MIMLQQIDLPSIPKLQQVGRTAYTQNFGPAWTQNGLELYLDDQFGSARLEKEIGDPSIGYYFIREQDQVSGFVKVNYQASLTGFEEGSCCELEKIYLLQEAKRKGLGTAVMKQIMAKARSFNRSYLFLCVLDSNEKAIAFYQKLGFHFHSKTRLEAEFFREDLKGMDRMLIPLS